MKQSISFLGLIVGTDVIRVNHDKVDAIKSWSYPKTITRLRIFLWLVQFFIRFIPKVSELAAPSTEMTNKNRNVWNWGAKSQLTFELLKERPFFSYPTICWLEARLQRTHRWILKFYRRHINEMWWSRKRISHSIFSKTDGRRTKLLRKQTGSSRTDPVPAEISLLSWRCWIINNCRQSGTALYIQEIQLKPEGR